MSTILPFEIVLLVLPNLKGQNADLQSCALVCEQWRRESQAYLFHTVTLTAVDQYQRLRNLVVQSSRISSFIRDISFNLGTFDEHTLDAMTTLLRFLKLESLSLGVCSQDDPHVRDLPPILSETMTVSLGHAVTSFTLQSISLSRIDLQNLFSRASSLRHLSLLKVTCTSHAEAEAFDDGGACTMIEELVMEVEDSNLLEWFCQEHCSVKLASLRSLTLVYDLEEDKHDLINEMLKRTGTALEDLHLKRSDGMF
ncbi:hypothetical protein H0H93_006454 [Arthromyces matolae]|nr:hypothetical protein H0H93_006454 [Arthromyces matolae]